jgi:hypothetical protein
MHNLVIIVTYDLFHVIVCVSKVSHVFVTEDGLCVNFFFHRSYQKISRTVG